MREHVKNKRTREYESPPWMKKRTKENKRDQKRVREPPLDALGEVRDGGLGLVLAPPLLLGVRGAEVPAGQAAGVNKGITEAQHTRTFID
jgi:hypothetical protein